jgi:hypothetical protein
MGSIPAEVAGIIESNWQQAKTNWSSTHPSPSERMQRADAMGCSGQELASDPARDLFENFEDLCRGVTIGHYHNLGVPVTNDCLVPVKVLVSGSTPAPEKAEQRQPAPATIPFQFDEPAALPAAAR